MSQAPSMPLFVDAFIADTTHLSAEEVGAYMRLLMSMWRHNGSIPDDDKDNARITGTGRNWKRVKSRLSPMLTLENGNITQGRLQKEWEYVQAYKELQRAKGVKSGEARRNKNKDLNGTTVPSRLEPQANPHSHTHIKKDSKNKIHARLSTVLDEERVEAVIEYRRLAKKALTEHSAKLLVASLLKCPNPNIAADEMIERNWSSVKPEWLTGTNTRAPPESELMAAARRNVERATG